MNNEWPMTNINIIISNDEDNIIENETENYY